MTDRPEIDFRAIIAGIEQSGLRRADIARSLKVSRSCITRLASGEHQSPSWPVGRGLMSLAERRAPSLLSQNAAAVFAIGNKT